MEIKMLIRWSAKPIGERTLNLGGSTEYLVTGELGEFGNGRFWAHSITMTQEMLEDDWLPDVCARIERLARKASPPPPIWSEQDEEGWLQIRPRDFLWGDKPISPELAAKLRGE